MTSLRQTEANRINALKSTGPVTDQGKQQSRRNALRHGLAGAGVVLPDDEEHAVARRAEDWAAFLDPAGDRDDWLVEQVALESVRLDRCQHQERARRAADAARAEVAWDDDRRIDAEALAAGLAKKPALLRRKLEMTTQGCGLLIERWHGLLGLLQSGAPWDGARRSLALDLLGVPPELRDGPGPLDPAPGGDPAEAQAALARAEVERLTTRQADWLDALDADEREMAILGLAPPGRVLVQLRRYEAGCQRRLRAALAQLRSPRQARAAEPEAPSAAPPCPTPAPAPEPAPAAWVQSSDLPPPPDAERLLDREREALEEIVAMLRGASPGPAAAAAPAPCPVPAPSPEPAPVPADDPSPSLKGNRRQRKAQLRRARAAG